LSGVLSLMHLHTCHEALLDRVTACVNHTENTTKFCGCGKSRVHYLGHCCQTTILHCTACCAVLCKLKLSLRCVLSGYTGTSLSPCIYLPSHIILYQGISVTSDLIKRNIKWFYRAFLKIICILIVLLSRDELTMVTGVTWTCW